MLGQSAKEKGELFKMMFEKEGFKGNMKKKNCTEFIRVHHV